MTTTPTASPELPDLEALMKDLSMGWGRERRTRTMQAIRDLFARRAKPEGEAPQALSQAAEKWAYEFVLNQSGPVERARLWNKVLEAADTRYAPAAQHAEKPLAPAILEGWADGKAHAESGAPAADAERVDAIVTGLYRRFKDWSKRGFGPDDVTWCEVKADVVALIASGGAALAAQSQDAQSPISNAVSKYVIELEGKVAELEAALAAKAEAPAAQQAAAPGALALLNTDELAALRRFYETCQDGEGYDVPKAMMQRLAEIGVVRRTSGSYYETTEFGLRVLHQPAPSAPGTPEALDADEMTRLRRLMKALGHADAFEQPDDYVRGILLTLLALAAGKLERAASAPGTPEAPQTAAARDVLAERQRQVEQEGWTPEHDDMHGDGQMAVAAGYYALASGSPYERSLGRGHMPIYWPWAPSWWKPRTKRENLVRAGALVLAEIERLDRAAQLDGGQGEEASHVE